MTNSSPAMLIEGLSRPEAYPYPVSQVKVVQTHISVIFLTDVFAFKVKKPVDLGFVDYSTRERREFFCRREVELNRRLAPRVYLGIAPIVRDERGWRVGGDGEPVEWCVVMERLPEDRLLSHLLRDGRVSAPDITAIAWKLAAFHQTAATGPAVDAYGHVYAIRVNTDENFRQLAPFVGRTVDSEPLRQIQTYTNRFLDQNAAIFAQRIREHRIRDGHGDLHAASICLSGGVQIFDCVEFNDRFRSGDVASEVAFLMMDLTHFGRPDLAEILARVYREASGDDLPPDLLAFYQCYRAVVRGKVASFELDEAEVSAADRAAAHREARAYLAQAATYAATVTREPMLAGRSRSE
jgi:aminoglycoside phosphotransferase family enzyme